MEVTPEQNTDFSDVKLHVLQVPALGYKVVWIGGAKRCWRERQRAARRRRTPAIRSRWKMRCFACVVDKQTGCITSLFDKKTNFETLASGACGNQLQFFKDTPKDYDAWNIDPGTLDVPPMTH